ncbi:hypothetical protein QBC38DRAFT_467905 [Podospora fimiseda]|uniref:Uncharacterized protein n=1 Tax=Podospora fimiseda TaxID=252190 RepID=A0AAN7BW95_9PEZI|nr:hypothetical protein QBC38DRAFT_467905 [Podospora fimiseda]
MEIDGVIHKFRYVDRMTLPKTDGLVRQAISLIKTQEDFNNVPRILEGLQHANRQLNPTHLNKIIRKAVTAERLDVIIQTVRAAKRTGFKLDRAELINELLVAIQWRAIHHGFEKKRTQHALKQTEDLIALLEDNKSLHHSKEGALKRPFYQDPLVLAARLHMAAAYAVHHQGGKDKDGKVTKYAEELYFHWKKGGVLDLYSAEAYRDRSKVRYLLDRNNFLYHISPVLNGLNLAAQVVDAGLAMHLRDTADAVDTEVGDAFYSKERKQGGRGESMYNWIFNYEATKEAELKAQAEEAAEEAESTA